MSFRSSSPVHEDFQPQGFLLFDAAPRLVFQESDVLGVAQRLATPRARRERRPSGERSRREDGLQLVEAAYEIDVNGLAARSECERRFS